MKYASPGCTRQHPTINLCSGEHLKSFLLLAQPAQRAQASHKPTTTRLTFDCLSNNNEQTTNSNWFWAHKKELKVKAKDATPLIWAYLANGKTKITDQPPKWATHMLARSTSLVLQVVELLYTLWLQRLVSYSNKLAYLSDGTGDARSLPHSALHFVNNAFYMYVVSAAL